MSDGHDQLFYDLIKAFPADFLTLVAPEIAARVDLGALDFRREEYYADDPTGGTPRRPDLVARVPTCRDPSRFGPLKADEPEEVVLHVEVEYEYREPMPMRLFDYNQMLCQRNRLLPVETIVLYLHGGTAGVEEEVYEHGWLGRVVTSTTYTSVGLSGACAAEYLARPEPLAWALAALMRPRLVGTRAELRMACLRRILATREIDENRRFLLFNCVATYIESDVEVADEYEALLKAQENEEVRVAMMTWADNRKEEGRQEGRQEGMHDLLLHQLTKRFGSLPPAVKERISKISSPRELRRLAEQLLEADSLEALGLA